MTSYQTRLAREEAAAAVDQRDLAREIGKRQIRVTSLAYVGEIAGQFVLFAHGLREGPLLGRIEIGADGNPAVDAERLANTSAM